MRTTIFGGLAMVALLVPGIAAQTPGGAQGPEAAPAQLTLQPSSKLWVEGTSTVRSYRCEATRLEGGVQTGTAAAVIAVAELSGQVSTAEVTVPVAQLECGNGTMNEHLRKALRAEQHPAIRFRLGSQEVAVLESGDGEATIEGWLAIAGKENPITLNAEVSPAADGGIRVRGSKEIDMTEFGVQPPKLMLGTLKVNKKVVVRFDVVLKS